MTTLHLKVKLPCQGCYTALTNILEGHKLRKEFEFNVEFETKILTLHSEMLSQEQLQTTVLKDIRRYLETEA